MERADKDGLTMLVATNYNSGPRPAEVLVKDGWAVLVPLRETVEVLLVLQMEDLLRGDSHGQAPP